MIDLERLKYRAKDIENGQWVYGQLVAPSEGYYIVTEDDEYEVDPETLGQCTTVKDNTGKYIYEGDIVECVSWNEYWNIIDRNGNNIRDNFRRFMSVVWKNGAFRLLERFDDVMKPSTWDMIMDGDLSVIGNIHDNPGLDNNKSFIDRVINGGT